MNKSKCVRAKNSTLEKLHGNYNEQCAKLYAHLVELRGSNPGTTTIYKLDERRFERLYLCMQAMKDGFKEGCRPIIGLNGCHLKGYYQCHLLAAVGIDAYNSVYPIAFAVVEGENQSSWNWFLEILGNDLEINKSNSFTFMTDRQKLMAQLCSPFFGLMEVVLVLFPYSEHRTCVRHLYSNPKTNVFTGKTLKDQLGKTARATYEREFESAMRN
ncbi:hypothetical protein V6N13_063899 [Hibiscus sabdariffa]